METLLDKTIALAKQRDIPISKICEDTGLKPRWLNKLLAGEMQDPGVQKIERLYSYLQGREKTA